MVDAVLTLGFAVGTLPADVLVLEPDAVGFVELLDAFDVMLPIGCLVLTCG